ncbi:MAG: aldehyde dehydrogenase family protein, partial [Polaromonas sp.]
MASSSSVQEIISINPATGAEIARVAVTTLPELDLAVERAWQAFHHSGWKSLLPHKRALVLHAIADGLLAEKESLARLQMQDNGKPL